MEGGREGERERETEVTNIGDRAHRPIVAMNAAPNYQTNSFYLSGFKLAVLISLHIHLRSGWEVCFSVGA